MISNSIVICTYNQKETLSQALESLRRQIKNIKEFEVIIADDCSSDGTDEFVKKARFPIFLKYVRSDSNRGVVYNRNRGFQKAAGQWVIFMDGDMVPAPGFIDGYARAWREFPDGVCVGRYGPPTQWAVQPWQKYLITRGRHSLPHGAQVPGKYFTSGNFSIPKSIFEKVSGFDPEFKGWGGDDTDFGFRLEEQHIPIYNIPEAYCSHHDAKKLEDVIGQYIKFGRIVYPLLLKKHPDKVIFKNGWLLGLPDSIDGFSMRLAASLLSPLRTEPSLALLRAMAHFKQGAFLGDTFFDWLFYGHLAKGYRLSKSEKIG
jgi:glycosyltransferase involved in cell wall biosynthesis